MTSIKFGGPLFLREEASYRPTDYCRGPWSLETLHGGAVAGLLAHAVESAAPDDGSMRCSRLTVEMHQPVPLDVLTATAQVVKPGRRTIVIDGEIHFDNKRVARATSQWVATVGAEPENSPNDATSTNHAAAMRALRPGSASNPRCHDGFDYPKPGFNCDTAELRYVSGSHEEPGPGSTWLRLVSQLVDGEATSPFVRAAIVSDLAAAAGWEMSPSGDNYINPDVTLQLAREPRGPWLFIDANAVHGVGSAMMTGLLCDDFGTVGHILQSLVEVPMQFDVSDSQ